MIIDLDKNEELDHITVNGIKYIVWDIPGEIKERIINMKPNKRNLYRKRKPIIIEILKIKNDYVQDMRYRTDDKLDAFIFHITNKLTKW